MKIAYAILSCLLFGAAIAAYARCLDFMALVPSLHLASVWSDIDIDLAPGGNLASVPIVIAILIFKLRPKARPMGRITLALLLLLAIVPPVSAGLSALHMLSSIETASRAFGGVSMQTRAPNYAEVYLILATGLAAGAAGFAALATLQWRRP